MPDLVLIDGGVGQLNAAMAALDSLGLDLPIAALAKREELVWLPAASEPLRLDSSDPAHLVLRETRDEAHRFAVSRHRSRRSKRTLSTQLLAVPGHRTGPGPRVAQPLRVGSRSPTGDGRMSCNVRSDHGSERHLWQSPPRRRVVCRRLLNEELGIRN